MTININLLPWREELKELQKKSFLSMLGLGIVVTSGLVLCIHILINRQIGFQNENNDYLKNEIKILDQQISEIQRLQTEKEQLLARMDIIQQLQTNRPLVVRLFDVIVHTVPEGLYLTNLTRTGPKIMIDGKAESNTRVSTFMRNIEGSHWLNSPVLTLIQAEDQKEGNKQTDRMIGFNLQAIEAFDSQANLKGTKEEQGKPITEKTPSTQPPPHPSAPK